MPLRVPDRLNIASWFVDRPADAHAARVAIAGVSAVATYGELRAIVNRAGNALRENGVRIGDRVLLALADSIEFIAAFFGAAKIGAVAVPVNPFGQAADFSYCLNDCGARVAVVSAKALEEFERGAREANHLRARIVAHAGVEERPVAGSGWKLWDEWLLGASTELEAVDTASSDLALFLYTSGSTGKPKAAVHQHKDMLVTTECFARHVMQITEADRTFSVSKLFFAYGLGNAMYYPLAVGASTVLHADRPRPNKVLELVAHFRPTIFYAVPTFYAALLRAVEGGAKADFSSVRLTVSAGEPLPMEIYDQFKRRFGLEILDAIGSTEMLHMFISNRPGQIRPGSCGKPLAHCEARILDEDEKDVPVDTVGNLWVRGQSMCSEYWNRPEATMQMRRGEWVATGDKFYCDSDGYYFYCGRADDMLKASGMWVSPTEVENILLGHPAVAEAAVIGRPDSLGLTRPMAYLVLKGGVAGSAEMAGEILEFAKARLAPYKRPHEIVFAAELPKTATGKIQRFRLRNP